MKVSDVIVKIIEQWSFEDVFMVTGGGSMHLNDSFGRSKKITTVPLHHEQSCSMAADAYYRVKNKPAVVNVTTGPGGINALNGVYGAYVDSIPMVIISGQIKTEHLVKNIDQNLRQFGDQEARIVEMAACITKESILLETTQNLLNIVNEAILKSNTGRKGPVWIDIPLDIQASDLKTSIKQIKEVSKKWIQKLKIDKYSIKKSEEIKLKKLINLINKSERPVIIAGNGVRFSGNLDLFHKFVQKNSIPVCTVWNSHDLYTNDQKNYAGRPGADGERAGNFNMQNADLLIILGARMHVRQIGFDEKSFARDALKVMVDMDIAELNKPNLDIDLKIHMNLSAFFKKMKEMSNRINDSNLKHEKYLLWCKKNVRELPVVQERHFKSFKGTVNPYHFTDSLFNKISRNTDIVTGDGTAAVVTFKAAKLKNGQRLFTNKGCASMGYDLPAILGALYASGNDKRNKILITGDGSIMMNLQELSSLRPFKDKNLKIFILNNEGYHSIRQSQFNYFNGFEVGCGEKSKLYMPSFKNIAKSYDIKYLKVTNNNTLNKAILNNDVGIKIIEVMIDKSQTFEPRVSATKLPNGKMISSPLEEMSPLLDKEDFKKRMLIPLAKNSNYD